MNEDLSLLTNPFRVYFDCFVENIQNFLIFYLTNRQIAVRILLEELYVFLLGRKEAHWNSTKKGKVQKFHLGEGMLCSNKI